MSLSVVDVEFKRRAWQVADACIYIKCFYWVSIEYKMCKVTLNW